MRRSLAVGLSTSKSSGCHLQCNEFSCSSHVTAVRLPAILAQRCLSVSRGPVHLYSGIGLLLQWAGLAPSGSLLPRVAPRLPLLLAAPFLAASSGHCCFSQSRTALLLSAAAPSHSAQSRSFWVDPVPPPGFSCRSPGGWREAGALSQHSYLCHPIWALAVTMALLASPVVE